MRVSVVGTGAMGTAVAEALLKAGHSVTVQNRTRSRTEPLTKLGATAVDTAAEAITASDLTFLVLFDADSTRQVLSDEGARNAIRGSALLNVAATTPDEVIDLAKMVREDGGNLAEICIAGYPEHVRTRQADILLAADRDQVERWRSVLPGLGSQVHDLGAVGNASKSEMALWLPYMFQTIAVAYGLGAFERLGLPTSVVQSILRGNPVVSVAGAEELVSEMRGRAYGNKKWTVNNFVGSCDLIINFTRQLGLPTRNLEAVKEVYVDTVALGLGDKDVTAIYELFGPRSS